MPLTPESRETVLTMIEENVDCGIVKKLKCKCCMRRVVTRKSTTCGIGKNITEAWRYGWCGKFSRDEAV